MVLSYIVTLAAMYSKIQEHTPNNKTPMVQSASVIFVLTSDLNVGKGLSLLLIYIAFTINR